MSRCLACLTALLLFVASISHGEDSQTRPSADDAALKSWLLNMRAHRFADAEIRQVTGLDQATLEAALLRLGVPAAAPARTSGRLAVLPYPGGRHPRIGFLDGAVDPQRETKLSIFCPWDDRSYVVLDVPEAIWSNLGLTYLAHTHIDTVWSKQGVTLPRQEWRANEDGSYEMERRLPNGIVFGSKATPRAAHLDLEMWLYNGSDQPLSDLRVQNCVMLKGAEGFAGQTNDNKLFRDGYAVAGSADKSRWIVTAWAPLHRAWGNPPCPCLHSDPKFPDCQPGETKRLRGWLSFFEGRDIDGELKRIEETKWRQRPLDHVTGNLTIDVVDHDTQRPLPCRLYIESLDANAEPRWHFAQPVSAAGKAIIYDRVSRTGSVEKHTTLSPHTFQAQLPPGRYRVRAEHGKEHLPGEAEIEIGATGKSAVRLTPRRFINMAARGWYSGDTHVHRSLEELPLVALSEDLNVTLPLTYWVRDSREIPARMPGAPGSRSWAASPAPLSLDATHVIYPVNTEYEIFTVDGKRHTQGAVFVLNHQSPLQLSAPPVSKLAAEARRQGGLLDFDKHSWNWSMMIAPVMRVDLFELSNNHHWRTQFGFPQWTLENAPDWPEIERDRRGFTERGWTNFGLETYYTLLNCGLRMRVTGGTASGVHPVPLGYGRVYVHCGDHFNYETWIQRLNAGHSFVTQGPLLDVKFNGQLPGVTSALPARDKGAAGSLPPLQVTGMVESEFPLITVDLVRNGEVVQQMIPPAGNHSGPQRTPLQMEVDVSESSWFALRCFERTPDGKVRFAHTNPVFYDVADKPIRPRRERIEFLIRRMDEELQRNEGLLDETSLNEFRRAKAFYQERLKNSR
ncbi:MAG: CehA/McbA family metallohydrolase [Planctomycetales bacterium]|nr:CehA/McbA family metallohydrolase [Planctomycetales bacterium]